MKAKDIRKLVRNRYGGIARQGGSCCSTGGSSCCSAAPEVSTEQTIGKTIGYTTEEMSSVPERSNLGLGCGNPTIMSSLKKGETVLDLGSGAGFDCFLAAQAVGKKGRVIGVDMTPDMVERASENAESAGYRNVEFRLGEIENLPVADSSVDLIISNCVINLVVEKSRAFEEAFRVLKPGGRMMISDIVLLDALPKRILESAAAYTGCVSGASLRKEYLELIHRAGFEDIRIVSETSFSGDLVLNDPIARSLKAEGSITDSNLMDIAEKIASITVSAVKPE